MENEIYIKQICHLEKCKFELIFYCCRVDKMEYSVTGHLRVLIYKTAIRPAIVYGNATWPVAAGLMVCSYHFTTQNGQWKSS